jgi:hypothetical protein
MSQGANIIQVICLCLSHFLSIGAIHIEMGTVILAAILSTPQLDAFT